MALIKFGSLVAAGSGKIGGHCVQRSRGGVQLKTNAFNRMAPSEQQFWIRSVNKQLAASWHNLTDSERSTWNNFAPGTLSGQNCFYSKNFIYLFNNLPVCSDPYACRQYPLSAELITDPNFLTGSPWVFDPCWSFTPGSMRFDASAPGGFYQSCNIISGRQYRIQINIATGNGDNRFALSNELGQDVFPAPLNDYTSKPVGQNIYLLTALSDSTLFYLYADSTGSSFSVTYVSLKLIL